MSNNSVELTTKKGPDMKKVIIIGPFHYQYVNLENVKKEIQIGIIKSGVISFYIPPDDLTYENKKVTTRWLWSSGKDQYTIQSDIVPVVIHSSHFVPKKTHKLTYYYGVIANFKYLQKRVSKLGMKRKNGIRSRFSSKEANHFVRILDIIILHKEEDFPKNIFVSTDGWVNFYKKIDLITSINCSLQYLKMAKKANRNFEEFEID